MNVIIRFLDNHLEEVVLECPAWPGIRCFVNWTAWAERGKSNWRWKVQASMRYRVQPRVTPPC